MLFTSSFRWLLLTRVYRYSSFMYTPEGKEIMGRLWETMEGFSSFNVDTILRSL